MSGFLLDTNVISELVKARPEAKVVGWIRALDESLVCLSVLTLGEIRQGVDRIPDATRKIKLKAWLSGELVLRFTGRILAVDQSVADRWGQITALAKHPLPVIDGLLAATAIEHNLTFVTRSAKDVADTGASVFNPWNS